VGNIMVRKSDFDLFLHRHTTVSLPQGPRKMQPPKPSSYHLRAVRSRLALRNAGAGALGEAAVRRAGKRP
jgi:hypothetical protein